MRRGEIYVAAARGASTGKPRPVVVIQDDRFDATGSVTACPLTTHSIAAPLLRLKVEPSVANGLDQTSQIMVDKVTTIPRGNVTERLGQVDSADLIQLNLSLLVFLGLAG